MSKPIHLMRWAPADFLLDAFVLGCLRRRDFRTFTFYAVFLFKSHIEGGSLPADPAALVDHVYMRPADIAPALAACVAAGKVIVSGDRAYHKRVAKGIAEEMTYREQQAEIGRLGGRPRKGSGLGAEKGTLLDPESPPTPTPTPAPTPSPTPNPTPNARVGPVGALEKAQAECQGELLQASEAMRIQPDALLAKYSRTPSGATLIRVDTCSSVPWLRTTAQRLRGARLAASVDGADRPLDGFAALAARVRD